MTGSQFYDYIVKIFRRTDKSADVYEAITDAVIEVRKRYVFEDFKDMTLLTGIVALGNWKLTLPNDFGHIIGDIRLLDDNGKSDPIHKISKEDFDRLYPYQDEADVNKGVPKHFCVYGGKILLGPVPDSISYDYEINYSTEDAANIVAGTTAVPFTDRDRNMLRCFVLANLYFGLDDDEKGTKWKSLGEEKIRLLIENDERNIRASSSVQYRDI